MSSPKGPAMRGLQTLEDGNSEFNAMVAIVRSMLSRVATTTLVQVTKVTNDGGLSPVGFVDVQPMIHQVDGDGIALPHGIIPNVPYSRLQGGGNAVILDPQVGDIGVAVFASRSIASVIANRAPSPPGNNGSFRWSDALYIGGLLNGTPTQFLQFSDDGIRLHSPTKVTLEAPAVEVFCQTLAISASASVTITTPTFTVNGNTTLAGSATVEGLATVATLASGATVFSSTVEVGGKDIGAAHEHMLTGGGHTLGVV